MISFAEFAEHLKRSIALCEPQPRPLIAQASLGSLPYAFDVFGEIAVRLLTPGGFK
jgi:hypothetical protein